MALLAGGIYLYTKPKIATPENKTVTVVSPGDPSLAKSCGTSYRAYLGIDKATATDDQIELNKKAQICFSNVVTKVTIANCESLPALFSVTQGTTLTIENTGPGLADLSIRPNPTSNATSPQDTQNFKIGAGLTHDVKLVSAPTAGGTLAFHLYCQLSSNHEVDSALFQLGK